ncbi:hypothetical protein SAMN05660971_03492 [Halomonas cupida]|uniref:Uncharacterized protein n=1 Tax=Halomonas cupida TaxID=44933 RepID=A0A1M7KGD3_9GAMM|nr:hypothetical protein SAMN05660971_03492 [Halomonas cupida]
MPAVASSPTRSPRGVTKPVAARLLPNERSELESLAERESRSCSAMLRLVFLRGLESYRRDTEVAS